MPDEVRKLNVPRASAVVFERNLLRSVTCELRFPTLLALEKKAPIELQGALRGDYPNYEPGANISPLQTERVHFLRSKDRRWSVTFKASAVALETDKYRNFEDFLARLRKVVAAARKLLDTDFYTRVGLRSVDVLPVGQRELAGWLNPALIAPLADGTYGDVDQFWQEVRGRAPVGKYLFRHGVASTGPSVPPEYFLDFDLYEDDVDTSQLEPLLNQLHLASFDLFAWAIGEKAREHMGRATPKGGR